MVATESILAHWVYEPYEWEYFIETEWARVALQLRKHLISVGFPFPAFILFAGVLGFLTSGWVAGMVGLLWLGVPGAAFIGGTNFYTFNSKRRWFERLRSVPREVLIYEDAVVFGGPKYVRSDLNRTIRGFGLGLRTKVEPGDFGHICFDITNYWARGSTEQVRVLLPGGHEAEAKALAAHFRTRKR